MLRSLLAVVILALTPGSAAALHGEVPIQLKSIQILVMMDGNVRARLPVTVYAALNKEEDVVQFCRVDRAIRKVVRNEMELNPVTWKDGHLDYKKFSERIVWIERVIEQSVIRGVIAHLFLLPGEMPIGQGTSITRLQGTHPACMSLKGFPKELGAYLRLLNVPEAAARKKQAPAKEHVVHPAFRKEEKAKTEEAQAPAADRQQAEAPRKSLFETPDLAKQFEERNKPPETKAPRDDGVPVWFIVVAGIGGFLLAGGLVWFAVAGARKRRKGDGENEEDEEDEESFEPFDAKE